MVADSMAFVSQHGCVRWADGPLHVHGDSRRQTHGTLQMLSSPTTCLSALSWVCVSVRNVCDSTYARRHSAANYPPQDADGPDQFTRPLPGAVPLQSARHRWVSHFPCNWFVLSHRMQFQGPQISAMRSELKFAGPDFTAVGQLALGQRLGGTGAGFTYFQAVTKQLALGGGQCCHASPLHPLALFLPPQWC
jgi:hypothetical protein